MPLPSPRLVSEQSNTRITTNKPLFSYCISNTENLTVPADAEHFSEWTKHYSAGFQALIGEFNIVDIETGFLYSSEKCCLALGSIYGRAGEALGATNYSKISDGIAEQAYVPANELRSKSFFDIDRPCFPCWNRWSRVYTHWLVEACYSALCFLDSFPHGILLLPSLVTSAQINILLELGVPEASLQIIPPSYYVRSSRLVSSQSLYAYTWYDHDVHRIIGSRSLSANPQDPSTLLYISRIASPARKCTNEAELIKALEGIGFASVCLEDLTFSEQVQLFSSSRMVVAAHGSGLANALFMQPETHVLEIMPSGFLDRPRIFDRSFWTLSSSASINHSIIYAVNNPDSDFWTAPCNQVLEFCNKLLSD